VAPNGGAAYAAGRWVTAVGLDGGGVRWRLFVGPGGSVAVLPDGRHVCAGSCDDLVGFSGGAVLARAGDPAVAALRLDRGRGPGPR
ncbi:MAG: hypothetical protein QME96_13585, partial [Myxococcota bacterium]|nr:hypothetical protein [Myxococcota bacterium]